MDVQAVTLLEILPVLWFHIAFWPLTPSIAQGTYVDACEVPRSGKLLLICKSADNVILSARISAKNIEARTTVSTFAAQGLRTLVIAQRSFLRMQELVGSV